jgi:phenylalanyl-tRNA synthetase beta chain
MLASFNWLKEFVNIDQDVQTFGDILTMSGTKVETITPINENVKGIVTGKIIEIKKHPNADHLYLCTVDFGNNKTLPIVTNAQNVFEGAIVPVALDGAIIDTGTQINASEVRDVRSEGMMCSVKEMGLDTSLFNKEATQKVYIFPQGTEIGADVRELYWVNDHVIDIELTANRGDCQSIYGIAKEAAAALDQPIRPVELYQTSKEQNSEIENYLQVDVKDDHCKRYTAKVLKVNKIEPSPIWMQRKLLNSGVRPINNIVDVTNYVMIELGQPLHAFDYDNIGTKKIVVSCVQNPTFTTLDGEERKIDDQMMMITNGEKPIAIAGIMGGLNSEITEKTQFMVLESAFFDKTSIRTTSRKLGLRTEASSRYEKGSYAELCKMASLRATYLLEKIGACTAVPGFIDIYPNPEEKFSITVDCQWVNQYLGIHISKEDMIAILKRLFLEVDALEGEKIKVTVPNDRQDLRIREDIAEEVARIYGYDKIPNTLMQGSTLIGHKTDAQQYQEQVENLLIGAGFYQTMTTSFTSQKIIESMRLQDNEAPVKILNPLGEDTSIMRFTLAGQQLELISMNYNRKNPKGRFFEIAATYHVNSNSDELPIQKKHLVLSTYHDGDFYDLKGVIEMLFQHQNVRFEAGGRELYHPGRKAVVTVNGKRIGDFGEIHPVVAKQLSLPKRVYLAELDFDEMIALNAGYTAKFKSLPKYPASQRDLAVVIDIDVPAVKVEDVINRHRGDIIESVKLFDVYQGEQIPDDKKSLAYTITFRHADRTLKDREINKVMNAIVSELQDELQAQLRDE